MSNTGDAIAAFVILIFGMLLGVFIGSMAANDTWKHAAIKAGHAQHNPPTGAVEWIEPAHNAATRQGATDGT